MSHKSFIYTLESRDPRIDPRGAPKQSAFALPIRTCVALRSSVVPPATALQFDVFLMLTYS
jgi:hypothetical protein